MFLNPKRQLFFKYYLKIVFYACYCYVKLDVSSWAHWALYFFAQYLVFRALLGTRYKDFLVLRKHFSGAWIFIFLWLFLFASILNNLLLLLIYFSKLYVFATAALLPGTRLITIKRPLTIKMPGLVKTVSASALVETMTSSQLSSPNNEQETQSESAIVAHPTPTTDDSNTEEPLPQTSQPDEPLNNSSAVSFLLQLCSYLMLFHLN